MKKGVVYMSVVLLALGCSSCSAKEDPTAHNPGRPVEREADSSTSVGRSRQVATVVEGKEQELPQSYFELDVVNDSDVKIYPTVRSGDKEESFGVVGPHLSASVGFTPFKIGQAVSVVWSEARLSNPKQSAELDTKPFEGSKVAILRVIYKGKGKWMLKAFDHKEKEITPKAPD